MPLTIYADGGNNGSNPSTSVYWSVAIYRGETLLYKETVQSPFYSTNNEAEYMAVDLAISQGIKYEQPNELIDIRSDSQLVVNQINGLWKCKKKPLQDLLANIYLRDNMRLSWVSRDLIVEYLGH